MRFIRLTPFSPSSIFAFTLLASTTAIAQVSFSTKTDSKTLLWNPEGDNTASVRADLNGDGLEDFVSWNLCSGSGFSITLSTGDGTYAAPVCYPVPVGNPSEFAVGDFYGTGKLDVAASNGQGDLYIYKNSGNGTLTLASSLTEPGATSGDQAISIVAADVNHDGHIDLVYDVQNRSTNNGGSLYVLFGHGDGTFTNGPVTPFTLSNEPAGNLSVGDFDGDGKADLMVLGINLNHAGIFYGEATGYFTPGPIVGSTALATDYQAFDVDSQGTMDLIGAPYTFNSNSTNTYYNYLDLELSHYGRTLTDQKVPLQHCTVAAPPQVADFDGDGIADIVVAEASDCKGDGPYTLDFLKGNGNGTFRPEQVIYSTSYPIQEYHVMRASHSSKPDLALWQFQVVVGTVTDSEELVLVNTTSGNFPSCSPSSYRAVGINVCGPTSTVSPTQQVNFSFAGSNQTPGRDMEIWIDGQKVAENLKTTYTHYSFIGDTTTLSNGEHQVAIFSVGWDYSLLLTQFPLLVGSSTCPVPSGLAVNGCSPIDNSTLTSPVLAYASGAVASGQAIVRMEVWVDGVKKYSTFGSNSLKTTLSLAPGLHQFTYFIVDNSGNKASKTYYAEVH